MAVPAAAYNDTLAKALRNSSTVSRNVSADPPGHSGAAGFFAPQAGRIPSGSLALIVVLALFVPIILFGILFALIARRRKRPVFLDDILEQASGIGKQPGSSAGRGSSRIRKPQRPITSWAEMIFGRWSFNEERSWEGRLSQPPDEEEPAWESQYPKIIRPQKARNNGNDATTSNGESSSEEAYNPLPCSPGSQSCTPPSGRTTFGPTSKAVAMVEEASSSSQNSQAPPFYPMLPSHRGCDPPHSRVGVNSSAAMPAAAAAAAAAAGISGSSTSTSAANQPIPVTPTAGRLSHPLTESCKAGGLAAKQQPQEIEPEGLSEVESWRSCCSHDSTDPESYQSEARESSSAAGHQVVNQSQFQGPAAVPGHTLWAATGTSKAAAAPLAGRTKEGTTPADHLSGEEIKSSSSMAAAAAGPVGAGITVRDMDPLPTPFAAAANEPFERKRSYRSNTSWSSKPGV